MWNDQGHGRIINNNDLSNNLGKHGPLTMLSVKMHMGTVECLVEGEDGDGTEVGTETMKETIEGIIKVAIRGIIEGATRGIIQGATRVIIQGATRGIIKMVGIQTGAKAGLVALVPEVIAIMGLIPKRQGVAVLKGWMVSLEMVLQEGMI